jgi:hypothetical protein
MLDSSGAGSRDHDDSVYTGQGLRAGIQEYGDRQQEGRVSEM